jgi:hypothetical protein
MKKQNEEREGLCCGEGKMSLSPIEGVPRESKDWRRKAKEGLERGVD